MIGIGTVKRPPGPARLRGPLIAALGSAAYVVSVASPAGATAAARPGAHAQASYQFPVPAVGLVKSASPDTYSQAGTVITYTYRVTNTGDAPLSNAAVTDPMAGLSAINCGGGRPVIPSLAVGASGTCTATYTTTSSDVASGSISNTGTVTAHGPTGSLTYHDSVTISATGQPFSCKYPPLYFLSESHSTGGPTTFYDTLPYPHFPVYSVQGTYPHGYNAIGFDAHSGPGQNYIFGMTSDKLIKISAPGNVGTPTAITGFPALSPSPVVGAFDPNGNYWVTQGGSSSAAYKINVAAPALTGTLHLHAAFEPYDWTWTAGYGYPQGDGSSYPGFLWGLSGNQLYRVSTASGAVSHWTVPGIAATPAVYGAAFTFANGNLGFSNNATGLIYEISVGSPAVAASGSPSRTVTGAPWPGPQVANKLNDGTSCLGQEATNLGVAASGPATVTAGSPVSWNVTITNHGPGESSGFLLNDTTKGVSDVTTSTPGCTVTGKGLQVQCAEGALDNGDPYTVTLSGTAPQTAGACVTSTATVIANEQDPTAKNNTATAKTCTTPASGDIGTVAGDGTAAYSGDGGPATAAGIYNPLGIAVDGAGNELIAAVGDQRIRVVARSTGTFYGQKMTAGDIYTIAGDGTSGFSGDGGPATSAELNAPYGTAVDSAGDLLITDNGNNRVREVVG